MEANGSVGRILCRDNTQTPGLNILFQFNLKNVKINFYQDLYIILE